MAAGTAILQVHVQPPSIANADQLLRSFQCMTWLVRLKEMESSMSMIPLRLSVPSLCGALVFVKSRPPRFSFPEMCSCVARVAKAPRARRLRACDTALSAALAATCAVCAALKRVAAVLTHDVSLAMATHSYSTMS